MVGIALLILWLLSRMALLSWADLSYVLPVTSLGYVASALIGRFFLNEQITPARWAGTLLIVAGTVLVGVGSPHARGRTCEGAGFCWALIVGSTVMGDLLQSLEMKRHGEIHEFHPRGIGRVLATLARKKFLILAIVFMAISFFAFMTLLEIGGPELRGAGFGGHAGV